ncbi:MAG TPA: ATP-binding protein [Candidatus Margulisiibacteriota bacterium]|nr:ATP-binding protein [Candidatus Margulisiibacteriota bacterium]
MSDLSAFQIANAAIHASLALVWAIVAHNAWRFLCAQRPHSRFFRMLPAVAGTVAFTYGVFTLTTLIPVELQQRRPDGILLIRALNDWSIFGVVALARHMARYFPTPEDPPPPRTWLALNYGSALLMDALCAIYLGLIGVPGIRPQFAAYSVIRIVYQLIMLALIVLRIVRIARPGLWGPGGGAWVARRADVVFLGGALVSLGGWLLLAVLTNWLPKPELWTLSPLGLVLDTIAGIGWAVPLAVRILGEVVRGFLIVTVMVVTTGAVYFGAQHLGASLASTELRPVLDLGTVATFVLVLAPGYRSLRVAVDHVVFRRSRRRRAELQEFLHTLSPELGLAECCRRALGEVSRVMRLQGGAIFLRDAEGIIHGTITFAPVEQLWRSGVAADVFPVRTLIGYELRELPAPLASALTDTDIVGVIPIVSPRQRWGLMLISAGLLGATFSEEDEQVLQAFADQFALVLDGAALLERAVAIERSLAHSEKLAAIGELAARIAHEIRNPVTAARSLAQQLAREPTSPLNAEHAGLILSELERVERQVAALLRFARREEFQFEPVDLSALARGAVEAFRPRLEAAGITIALHAPDSVVARADREKVRQVLINLIDNAVDALRDTSGVKRLDIVVSTANGSGTLSVHDNGPGVSAEALPRLCEPFFSLKPNGTGLGLAIARRTVEAHGGRIDVTLPAGGGMTVCIDLPLVSVEERPHSEACARDALHPRRR